MLSPHEFATLILVNDAPEQVGLDNADVEALLANQLVTLEKLGPCSYRPTVTLQGYVFLKALGRVRAKSCRACRVVH
ncbi:conserved hypothetical protein [Cupriavidus necator]|uniref:Uncharacterized protein n=1 Tax=Cupriavidus necator TaxID=106590 RepID=A0A1K0JLJ1_CUPNE|nr:conserved hypothetical protein [Cupriavidus necator]